MKASHARLRSDLLAAHKLLTALDLIETLRAELAIERAEKAALLKRLEPQAPQAPQAPRAPEKVQCPHATLSGAQCKKFCLPEATACAAHLAPKAPQEVQEKVLCSFITLKNNRCKKFCLPDAETCKVHHEAAPRTTRAPRPPPRAPCTGLNIRGNPCKEKCLEGQGFCARHDPEVTKAPSTKKAAKAKRPAPVHTHALGVEPLVPCELCETHGDIFDPRVTGATMVAEWDDEAIDSMLDALRLDV